METITIIAGTVVDLVEAVLKPLSGLGGFLEGIFEVFEKGSSALSSAEVEDPKAPVGGGNGTPA